MGWRLSMGLAVVRVAQILGCFIPGAMNGWLLYYIHANELDPSGSMLVLEVLAAALLAYSVCSVLITHTGRRSRGTACMAVSIGLDIVVCFALVAIISLLSYAGLPVNCAGLVTGPWSEEEKDGPPPPGGYSTTHFNDQHLDKYCNLERGYFFCAVLMILLYILSIMLSVLRICELNYTRNSQVQDLLDEREELLKLELKVQEQDLRPRARSPGHETTRSTSAAQPLMSPSSSSSVPSSFRNPGMSLAAIPQSSSRHHVYASVSPADPMSPLTAVVPDALDVDTSEIHANMAMISDGSRYSGNNTGVSNQLPPYSPRNLGIMHGHENEYDGPKNPENF